MNCYICGNYTWGDFLESGSVLRTGLHQFSSITKCHNDLLCRWAFKLFCEFASDGKKKSR